MSEELILHHYDSSPFGEKIRLALGLKNLRWRSVINSVVPPRPFLTPLTGGYRRIPVLQIGADIYCDTHLILRTIDRLRPDAPSLFANKTTEPLCWWWDKATFAPAVAIWASFVGDKLPKEFIDDRKTFAPGFELNKEASGANLSLHVQHINAHLVWLIDMLADGRPFLLGEPSALDVTAYHTLWLVKQNCGEGAATLLPDLYQPGVLLSWFERVAAFGHGTREALTQEQAFEIAKQATPVEPNYISQNIDNEWEIGDKLRIVPDDTGRVPVEGTLVAADRHEMVLRISDEKTGNINVHFPRAGFEVTRA
ncbi:unnamed protein product [Adineta ricciae]|uniref:GST N-terminal domain-containing protein n=1 Tax=Adineta ricciae TaxID=249248 RepID=A0A813SF96_ADIRI|nr:unnamed protein product [Adineta ricciae]CAF1032446.1 unnamed protein product [Adineta ricciae]